MTSSQKFKNFIAQFGVEIAIGAFIFFAAASMLIPQRDFFSKPAVATVEETKVVLSKIESSLERAHEAHKSLLASKKDEDLRLYNEEVLILNQNMGLLLQLGGKNTELLKNGKELNLLLKKHFEEINSVLTSKKVHSQNYSIASKEIYRLIDFIRQESGKKKKFELSRNFIFFVGLILFCLVIISRILNHKLLLSKFQKIRELENRSIVLDTILSSMSDALIVIDKQGYFTHYNSAAQRMVGNRVKSFSSDFDVSSCAFTDTNSGTSLLVKDLPIMKSLRGDHIDDQEIFIQNKANPQGIHVVMSSRPLNDIDGDIRGAIAVLKDISRRKMVELEWNRAREAAVDASLKKSDFLAAMSHEIRTPMNGVIGMTTLLADTPLNEEQRDYVGIVKRSAESLIMLINDILDFSKMEAGKLELDSKSFDLQEIATDVVEMFVPSVSEKNVEIDLKLNGKSGWFFNGDPVRIRQILVNLVGNAVKFTDKGHVHLEISQFEKIDAHATLKFEIKDTGPGLKEEERKSLFQKYFQTKNGKKVGGTGLGLSISRQLVDMMGGQIGVESVVGLGSNFWFTITLPQVPATDFSKLKAMPEQKFSNIFFGTVLLVEDQIVNQRVAQTYLKKLGLEVEVASNGLVAVDKFKQGKYDLILMDCHMPVLDGFEAAKRIRHLEGDGAERLPIIALTADSPEINGSKYRESMMDAHLSKPIDLKALIDVLGNWLTKRDQSVDVGTLLQMEDYRVRNTNLVTALIEDFESSAPELIEEMRRGLTILDREAVSLAAHALKSSSATLGAKKLAYICESIEQESDLDRMGALVNRAEELCLISLRELQNFSASREAA